MRPRKPKPNNEVGIAEVDAGIDWITIIADRRDEAERFEAYALDAMRSDINNGSNKRTWRFMGFNGWQTASMRLGYSSGRALIQSSGPAATVTATHLRSSTGRVTRLDVQATVTLSTSQPGFGTSALSRSPEGLARPPQSLPRTGQSSDSRGLFIGTVGPRTDPRYLRVYDKGIEKGSHPAGFRWRLECEAKQSLAGMLWEDFKNQRDVPAWCYASVESQWRQSGSRWPLPKSSLQGCAVRAVASPPADALRLAAWIKSSVAPTVPRILTRYTVEELLQLLGLDGLAAPTDLGRSLYDHS